MAETTFSKISFYIVAHADDWQLFMQPNAYNDLVTPGTKVVFIITTAGDAGACETYWPSREEGSKSSVRFCTSPLIKIVECIGTRAFNGHPINFWSTHNVTSYFLRLPDGNIDGNGFSKNNFYSLSRFVAGQIAEISAIDQSTTYSSWQDFCTTLGAIITWERSDVGNTNVNYLNPDVSTNASDHSDHISTGQAIQAIEFRGMQHHLFVGYSVASRHENLDPALLFWKAGMFAAYEKAVYDGSGYSTLKEDVSLYTRWCLSNGVFTTIHA
ncbi:MAG: PIG-L family deacetylase [Bacteroidota bacterium]|nr:PIG-L family deacetylase [Bacteroidota bacterium]